MQMERLWTVRDVMAVIPLGKTSCVKIVNSLPHITMGGKLMIEPRHIREWIARNTKTGTAAEAPAPVKRKPRARKIEGMTEDGLIPYRHTKKIG